MRIESESIHVRDQRQERWSGLISLVCMWLLGIGVAWIAGSTRSEGVAVCWVPLGLLVGTSLLLGHYQTGSLAGALRAERRPGTVTFEDGAFEVVTAAGVVRVPLEDLVSGWSEPAPTEQGWGVVLVTRGGLEVHVGLPPSLTAAEVLHAAGLSAEQRAVRLRLVPIAPGSGRASILFAAFSAGLAFLFFTLLTALLLPRTFSMFTALLAFATGASLVALGRRLAGTTLSIGADGVVLHRLGLRTVLRRSEITDVRLDRGALAFHLREPGRPRRVVRVLGTTAALLVAIDRIDEALRAAPETGTRLDRLDRGDRDVDAWLADVRALARAPIGYRVATLETRDLCAVVKDGGAPAERRIAAATALAGRDDPDARYALRVAADTCVDDPLRRILDAAAEGEVEAAAVEDAVRALGSRG